MREIKFRAWNGTRMIYRELCDQNWYSSSNYEESKHVCDAEPNDARTLKIMQYTNLKDKNGVEIYEGDIVIRKDKDASSSEWQAWIDQAFDVDPEQDQKLYDSIPLEEVVRDVVTMERFPVFWLKNESLGYEGDDLENPEHFKVIGNVYENPELLEG